MDYYDGETVGRNVRRLRHAAKLRQQDLADRTGFHQTVISSLETLRSRVSQTELDTLARGLGLDTTDELLKPVQELDEDRVAAKHAGASLRDRRAALGLSQAKLAAAVDDADVTQFQVSMAERGHPPALRAVRNEYEATLARLEAAA